MLRALRLWGKRLWALRGEEGGGHGDRAWTGGRTWGQSPQHHRLKPPDDGLGGRCCLRAEAAPLCCGKINSQAENGWGQGTACREMTLWGIFLLAQSGGGRSAEEGWSRRARGPLGFQARRLRTALHGGVTWGAGTWACHREAGAKLWATCRGLSWEGGSEQGGESDRPGGWK